MDSSKKDSERLVGRAASPSNLPELFWLAVAHQFRAAYLPGLPVVITHANGYCGAWPGWAVSVSVSPNISIGKIIFLFVTIK